VFGRTRGKDATLSRWELLVTVGLLAVLLGGLSVLLPTRLLVVVVAVTAMVAVFYVTSVSLVYYRDALPAWTESVPFWTTLAVPFTVVAVLLAKFDTAVPLATLALLFALILVFFYYWLVVPLALYQRLAEQHRRVEIAEWPALAVIVPTYNEAGYVGKTVDSFLAADYPDERLDVVVDDDGSTDGTIGELAAYDDADVTVLRKENGGKHSALNYGLTHTDASLVVTVDADSVVAPDALKTLVRSFEAHDDVGAVAGNVKVSNRGSLVTDVQALEYVLGINTFRRVFDLLGVVTVVPGCLGLFRRDALAAVGEYSADTLTEDFDATIALLERGFRVHHSGAVVYTEAPDTWTDLYRQRLRWFRGNLQTVLKHHHIFRSSEFGMLHRVGAPYLLMTMSVIPALGVVVVAAMLWTVGAGDPLQFVGLLGLFSLLQVLLSLLALRIEGEDLRLALYAPLSVVGYKQVLDVILIKSIVDVLTRRTVTWTSPTRVRQRDQ